MPHTAPRVSWLHDLRLAYPAHRGQAFARPPPRGTLQAARTKWLARMAWHACCLLIARRESKHMLAKILDGARRKNASYQVRSAASPHSSRVTRDLAVAAALDRAHARRRAISSGRVEDSRVVPRYHFLLLTFSFSAISRHDPFPKPRLHRPSRNLAR